MIARTPAAPARILVVEDDPAIAEGIQDNLQAEGYLVEHVADGQQGLERAVDWRPELILLDVMLPSLSGFEVLKELRRLQMTVPIILVTAKAEEFDRCLGLDLGADDYVVKPFSLAELLSRVNAQLRRVRQFLGVGQRLSFGQVEVDFSARSLKVGGRRVHATSTELAVLRFLADRAGQVFSRDQILDGVWGHGYYGTARTVDNFIRALRTKIEPDPDRPRYLVTMRGAGYCFDLEGTAARS